MYEISGTIGGRGVAVTWDDGRLSGDPIAVAMLQAQARVLEGADVGPECGPYTREGHLQSALSTLMLAHRVLDSIDDLTGDVPEIPQPPDGAVA